MKTMRMFWVCLLVLVSMVPVYAEIKNPDTFIKVTYGTVRTLDPCVAYDTTSSQRIENMYDRLIVFDGESTEKFAPVIATEVPTVENAGISADGLTYTFTIRKGVKFQEGGDLTPEDVEYSLERTMVLDPDGGPAWMLLEALTGEGSTRDKDGKLIPGIFEKIMNAVEVKGDQMVLHLPKPYPPLMGILSKSWAAILDKEWTMKQNDWDGTLESAPKVNNPAPGHEPLQKIANGSGPYKLKSWDPAGDFVFERFEGYWGPQPKIKTAIIKYVPEWSTRKLMLINGDVDTVDVDDPYVAEMADIKGLKSYQVPQLDLTAALFCQKVNPDQNTSIGSGKLDGEGIPPDFFADMNVRKAFLHAFDRATFAQDVLQNISIIPSSPNVKGLPYHIDAPVYEFDLEKAQEYMQKAWGGQVWEKGFKMTITYNTGNARREAAALMLAENINSLNPKFKVDTANVEWKDYLVKYRNFQYPIFIIGWGADYPDPHNFMYTFMHSQGVYGRYMAYQNDEVDQLCADGIATTDPAKRAEIYAKLQNLWYAEAIGLGVYQQTVVRYFRDWVQGFVPNPLDDNAAEWLYRLSKEEAK